jgi:hypothetical protein
VQTNHRGRGSSCGCGIHRQLHEVGEPADLLSAGGRAARQLAELVEIYRCRAFGHQVRIDEREVGELVLSVVVDVLGHVLVQNLQHLDVQSAAASTWNLAVLDAAELVVLLPEIRLEDLERREKLENRIITRCEAACCFRERRQGTRQHSGARGRRSYGKSFEQERTSSGTRCGQV